MADTKISALANAAALNGTEQLAGVQSAANVNITPAQIKTFTSASPTLVTPALGTPSSGTLTNCTGLPVAGGGTGAASLTAYAVMCGGTTSTGAVQSIASVGTAGQVLTSNGAGALPTFQSAAAGSPAGSGSEIQYRNGGAFGAMSGTAWDDTNRSLTLTGATVTTSNPVLNLTQTWNAAGVTFTGLKFNATNTASAATSALIDLQVGGSSQFRAMKSGQEIRLGTDSGGDRGSISTASYTMAFKVAGSGVAVLSDIGQMSVTSLTLGNSSSAGDVQLYRDAANTLALRNSTNAQTFRAYNTYTDASNYERASLTWSSNVCYLKAENAGTGSARLMVPVTGATTVSSLPSASTAGAGARSFVTDATATTFLSTVAGGGSNKVPVVSDGTNWLIG